MSTILARPFTDLLRLFVGPGVWFTHFTLLYGTEALICTPPVATPRTMIWMAAVATIAALGALALFARRLVQLPPLYEPPETYTGAAFLHTATLLLAALAALGVVWTALPVALLPVCATPAG
jgi:hypothetical protein